MRYRGCWLAAACLLGGLTTLTVAAGLQAEARTWDGAPYAEQFCGTGGVVINEVAWAGHSGHAADEWIELYNTTSATISLDDWHVVDDDNLCIALRGDVLPYGYYLIERTDNEAVSDVPAGWSGSFGSGLSNAGEVLTLTDRFGTVVDTANAEGGGWPAGLGSPDYVSMERVDPLAGDRDTNWASNDGVTRNGLDADGRPINGTPACRSSSASPAADLVAAFGDVPARVMAGHRLTYTLALRNAGNIVAVSSHLTNVLPAGLSFYTQTGAYSFSRPSSSALAWEVGDLPVSTVDSVITVVVDVDTAAAGTPQGVLTATAAVADVPVGNNVARMVLEVAGEPPSLPDLAVAKTGPAGVMPGDLVTYTVTLTNSGPVTAGKALLVDALPIGVDFCTQSSSLTFSRAGNVLTWEAAGLEPEASCAVTLTGRVTDSAQFAFTNWVTVTTVGGDAITGNNTSSSTVAVLPGVRLYALAPNNYGGSGEAAALINSAAYTVSLGGWRLNDDPGVSGVSFPQGAEIGPGRVVWLAQDADGFYPVWGFDAGWAARSELRPVQALGGDWPVGFLADAGDALYLFDDAGRLIDAVVYGAGQGSPGWVGPPVPYPYAGFGDGQVLYRKLAQTSGLPVRDTDAAVDWARILMIPSMAARCAIPAGIQRRSFSPPRFRPRPG